MSNLNNDFKIKNGLTVNTAISAGTCIEGDSFKKHGGTSSQFLKADGSVDSTSYTDCVGTVIASDLNNYVSDFDTGGDGLTYDVSDKTSILIEVDSTVARTNGNQTIGGTKSFTDTVCVNGGTTSVDALILTSTDNDSDAAPIQTFKRNTDSPQGGDYLGQLKFKGVNDNSQEVVYSKITGKINDEQGGTEGGLFETAVQKSGTMTIVARQTDTDLKLINGTGLQVDGQILSAGNELHSLLGGSGGGGGGGTVCSVTRGNCNIIIGGTANDPTVAVNTSCFSNCTGTVTCVDTESSNAGVYLSGGGSTMASIGIKSTCVARWEPPALFNVVDDSSTGKLTTNSFADIDTIWDTPSVLDTSGYSWNSSTGALTVLKSGTLQVTLKVVTWNNLNNRHQLVLRINKNGTFMVGDSQYASRSNTQDEGGAYIPSFIMPVAANDVITFQAKDVGVAATMGGSTQVGKMSYVSAVLYPS